MICEWCDQVMATAFSCGQEVFDDFPDGIVRRRIPYGSELSLHNPDAPVPQRCRDCGTTLGGFHHPGCDTERCPHCKEQAISCGCSSEDLEDEDMDEVYFDWLMSGND